MKKKVVNPLIIIIGIALLVIVASVLYFAIKPSSIETSSGAGTPIEQESASSAPVNYDIEIREFAFHPVEITLNAGDTVTWTNRDSVRHTVTSEGTGEKELNSGYLGNKPWDDTYSHTFNEPGTYNYYCIVHPSMKGTIIVQ